MALNYTLRANTYQDILNLISDDVYLVCDGRRVEKDSALDKDKNYHVCYRLVGGKGGFGSMLRTIGAQIEKTTNREAMRDLSGRRMRDINNEKKLADWVAGAADREKEREEKRRERLEKRRAEAEGRMHKFRDEKYMEQKDQVSTNLDDALTQGLKRSVAHDPSSAPKPKKSKAPSTVVGWAGVDIDNLSSSDDESSDSAADSITGSAKVKVEVKAINGSTSKSTTDTTKKSATESGTTSKTVDDTIMSVDSNTHDTSDDKNKSENLEKEQKPRESRSEQSNSSSLTMSNNTDSSQSADEQVDKVKSEQQTNTEDKQQTKTDESKAEEIKPIDLDSHNSAEELERYGLEHLKHDLLRRGLKCGGSLQQRSERLYSVKGLSNEEIDPSLFAKKKK